MFSNIRRKGALPASPSDLVRLLFVDMLLGEQQAYILSESRALTITGVRLVKPNDYDPYAAGQF